MMKALYFFVCKDLVRGARVQQRHLKWELKTCLSIIFLKFAKYAQLKSKYKILTFLFVSLFFSHNAISDSFESWKDIDSYYNKKKIDIYSLQDSDLEKLKIIKSIPKDFALLENVTKKKEIFYFITYPIIYKNNKDIQIERRVVLDIEKRYKKKIIEEDDIQDLKKLSKKYKLETDIIDKTLFKKLKQRINVIPISLALGQAIIESGWGQSRFAIEGNAIYGQWTFNAKQGLIPKKRDPDKNHTVKKFETLSESVKSYMYNINAVISKVSSITNAN